MATTRVTFRQVYITPGGTLDIEHEDGGLVQACRVDDAGGGNPEMSHMLTYVVVEPLKAQKSA